MKLSQSPNNGNILIHNNNNELLAILPEVFVFAHPRDQKNALIVNTTGIYNDEKNAFTATLEEGIYITGTRQNTIQAALQAIASSISVKGAAPGKSTTPDLKLLFDKITTYEQMYSFVKQHNTTNNPIKKDATGKITSEEYFVQGTGFQARITLHYYYHKSEPKKIDYILMSGNTANVKLPVKNYTHAANGQVSYSYEAIAVGS